MITLEQMRKHKEAKKSVQTATATDTAEAMDAGTSAGVKKSWLKRERAKQEAAVDTLDKTLKADDFKEGEEVVLKNSGHRDGMKGKVLPPLDMTEYAGFVPVELENGEKRLFQPICLTKTGALKGNYKEDESPSDFHERIMEALGKLSWARKILVNEGPHGDGGVGYYDTRFSYGIDFDQCDEATAKKRIGQVKKLLEKDFMPKSLMESGEFLNGNEAVYGIRRGKGKCDRIIVQATNPKIVGYLLEAMEKSAQICEMRDAEVDKALAAGGFKCVTVSDPNNSLVPLVQTVPGEPTTVQDFAAMEQYYRQKINTIQHKITATQRAEDLERVNAAFAGREFAAKPVRRDEAQYIYG